MVSKPQGHFEKKPDGTAPRMDGDRVVISGISGLYPQCNNVKEFSDLLYNKINPISSKNKHWDCAHPEVSQFTGTVPGLDRFDAQFFKVHFKLGNNMDSMSRKLLEQAYQAIYDAGLSPEHFAEKKVAVYVGTCISETEKVAFYVSNTKTGFGLVGCSKSMFANRISYWLNAKGPSVGIDEGCCSSIAALEQAYQALERGDCDAALVGGASLCLHPQSHVHYSRILKMSADGKTKSFDVDADGCAKSEAIIVFLLQRAKDALRVYADVLNVKSIYFPLLEDKMGPKYGFYRDPNTIKKFLRSFYEECNVRPEAVEYVEAFGSAVAEADKSELEVFNEVFCNDRSDPLLVGSVMSNVGYSEAASGLTSITKVLLGYNKGKLAANLHCANPRKDVSGLQEGRMRIMTDHQPFERTFVAVNSLSVTGSNAHVLLHGHYKPKILQRYKSNIPYLVTISGRQDSAVKNILENLKSRSIDPEELALLHNIHSMNISGHIGRGFVILDKNAEQKTVCLTEQCEYFDNARRPLWFVYSGMGSQWPGMGTQLMRIPVFAAAIERCQRVLQPKGLDLIHIITSPNKAIFDNILHSFVGIAAVQIGLTDILQELGLVPDNIIGHSVGELGCAYADGCFTAEEMILSAYSRGLVSLQTPFIKGSMAAVGLGYNEIKEMIPPEIEVACHNAAESSTISGPADVMRNFVDTLTAKGIFAKEVPCSNIAYHSRYIAVAGPGLLKYLSEVIKNPKPRSDRWVSTSVPRSRWNEPAAKYSSAEYHTNNLLSPVLFEETSLLIPADAVLVEVAPHGLLQAILKRSLPESCKHIPLTRRGHQDNALMVLQGIGKLFMEGYHPKLGNLYPKIEFPVSTGTPMLSHLVEWAHQEKWNLPLYESAHRKTAAAAKYVISVHDDEHSYLQGHVVGGKNVYPVSAILVAAWDTLAMSIGEQRKHVAVEFRDVHFFVQPILHSQRQMRISVALHRGTGYFEIMNDCSKVATGYALVKDTDDIMKVDKFDSIGDVVMRSEDIYKMFFDRDYFYTGDFRSIYNTNASFTEGHLLWINNWVTVIDGMLQLNYLRKKMDGVSQPVHIRSVYIDTQEHSLTDVVTINGTPTMKVNAVDLFDRTRCGGIIMEGVRFNVLTAKTEEVTLKTLQFVPRFQSNKTNVKTALLIHLQIVAENLNKNIMNVVEVKTDTDNIFNEFRDISNEIPGLKVIIKSINKNYEEQCSTLTNSDLVLVSNLSNDDDMFQLFFKALKCDSFVMCAEKYSPENIRMRPSTLYRTVASQATGEAYIHLSRWRPTSIAASNTAVTVRTQKDMALLSSTRDNLTHNHKLLILTPYPPVDGLKELVKGWRSDSKCNEVHLVMVNHKIAQNHNFDNVPELDLVYNVLDHGTWGGEYYVPMADDPTTAKSMTLESYRIGDLNCLHWIEMPESKAAGVNVTVHYAGLNNLDVKRATGQHSMLYKYDFSHNSYGMDFSGVTDSGVQIMGLVANGAASSRVKAVPELLWPVPKHWTMEDAATVPMPYAHAFYCLVIKTSMLPNRTILIHGGAGALGQASISIALAHGLQVFTTVSDTRKKHFLRKLFPDLKEDHIGNSRDSSFEEMVLNLTKGIGVDYIINCVKGELKQATIKTVAPLGITLDTTQIQNNEIFSLEMDQLSNERNYTTVDFSSIFAECNIVDMKKLQLLVSEGISRGYVRPLSRVTYSVNEVSRAFSLLEASQHRGRVLLQLKDGLPRAQPRIASSPNVSHVVISDDESLGTQLIGKLVKRGARKFLLHQPKFSNHCRFEIKSMETLGVEIKVSRTLLNNNKSVHSLLADSTNMGPVGGIYFVTTKSSDIGTKNEILNALDISSRKMCPSLKYFAIVTTETSFGNITCTSRTQDRLPATKLKLPSIKKIEDLPNLSEESTSVRNVCDALERALCSTQSIIAADVQKPRKHHLLLKIAATAGLVIPEDVSGTTLLQELGVTDEKSQAIAVFLHNEYHICLSRKNIMSLDVQKVRELEDTISGTDLKPAKGMDVFFSHVDTDELIATTEMVFLPTLTTSDSMRDDEFDVNQTYLCIVPGLEGHYERFRELCERIKVPAIVLQPGLDLPNESIQQMADRYAKVLLKKASLKNNYYLVGYESGVMVALEMAAILEQHGLTGTIYCIGTAPELFKKQLQAELRGLDTERKLQNAVIEHMFGLMMDTGTSLDIGDDDQVTWGERIEKCVRALLGRMPHSAQYARAQFEAAYGRIVQVMQYQPKPRQLKSKLVLLQTAAADDSDQPMASLQQYSKQPITVHKLQMPLAHAVKDLRCAAIINRYLDPDILEDFELRNLCETYLLNATSYMTSNDDPAA